MPCPASTKLMRRSQSGQWKATLAASPVVIVPYERDRVSLVIGPPTTGPVWLSLRAPNSGGVGIRFTSASVPLILTLGDHGQMVCGPIYAVSENGPEDVYVWDTSVGPVVEQ